MSVFDFRAIELHGREMWRREIILRALERAKALGLDALVLHETDFVHHVVYPRAYFDPQALWKDVPSRRGENAIFNNRAYFDHILRLAEAAGIAVWLNVKEIGFSDEVLDYRPDIVKAGAVCPSHPFLFEYVEAKTAELFADFPRLAGLIVSAGSQESRASRVQNKCRCESCRGEPLADWYLRLIETLHRPIRAAGKRLAFRDFAYKPADHEPLIAAVGRAPKDVIFCVKAMPHDFYLTFPPNPALGRLERETWIEYDVMGQFFGWGVFPCFVGEDLAHRIPHAARAGASGAILRVEWERINDLHCLDNLNAANLIAAAAILTGEAPDDVVVWRRWLEMKGHDSGAAPWLAETMDATLPIILRAVYLDGHVSADNCMLPRSIRRAWWGMEVRDSLAIWDKSREADLALDRPRIAALMSEKDEALALTRALITRLDRGDPALSPALADELRRAFAHFEIWVRGHVLAARVLILARWIDTGEADAKDRARLKEAIEAYAAFGAALRPLVENPDTPHHIALILDPGRVADVVREGRALAG
ncbi:MAG: hypothetical protein FJX47_08415 [Alphaproteobacteria bacterium]|nr:hypothetical protein [Alphaproteobacteria bacterium]